MPLAARAKPMPAKPKPQRDAKSVSAFLEQLRAEQPAHKAAWDETALARGVALTLVRMRRAAGLAQGEVAARAGWNKSHVSRLESATNGVPDLATIVRYATACRMTVSLLAARPGERGVEIESALPLNEPAPSRAEPEAVFVDDDRPVAAATYEP